MLTVINMMKDGWELASSAGPDSGAWIQQGGAGRGGASKSIHLNTLYGLYQRGYIERAGKGPGLGTVYRLTSKAHAL